METRLIAGAAGSAAALALLAAALAVAQTPAPAVAPAAPAPPGASPGPPPPALGPVVAPPVSPEAAEAPAEAVAEAKPKPQVEAPQGPPRPERSSFAVVAVLDKVTAETVRFEAPVGQRVRYRGLIFDTRACETWDPQGPHPRAAAWMAVQSEAALQSGLGAPAVFQGWMFARAPGVHPFQHAVYDAWLEGCAPAGSGPPPAA
ncbi:MAG TPA: DUF2155 domain-containing protein [Caulobacteraceae bacterium]|nr:DUF2155 domain-containing protein [Caulobacteraceae bacterium]